MIKKNNSLMVIGTVAIDSVETPFGKRPEVFGGSASYFSYAASFFIPVELVAVVGNDFPLQYRTMLEERGIDLAHLTVLHDQKTFRWKGKYESDLNSAITLDTQLNALASFQPKLKENSRPNYLFLANIDPTLQEQVLDQIKKPTCKLVACDTMNFWIQGKRQALAKVLKRVDMIIVNDGEARLLTQETSLIRAGRKIQEMGPSAVIIKKGEHGALLFCAAQFFALPAFPLEDVFDPTGAGDTFAGGVMGYLAQSEDQSFENMKKAIAYGSVVASFTVENFGLERLQKLTYEEIEERYQEFKHICHF